MKNPQFVACVFMIITLVVVLGHGYFVDHLEVDSSWGLAHATFYGDMSGNETMSNHKLLPPNYTKTVDVWCNPPQKHFDLSMPMFLKIAEYKAGIVPVAYRRVLCFKTDGMRFELKGNPYWLLVLVYNVGGVGQVVDVKIKGGNGDQWFQMTRNWGQNWQTSERLQGQTLSFRVTDSDGKVVQSDNVAPENWELNKVYEGKNFRL
ncbi:hypothetical protein CsatB_017518 [Cannabis sativa]